eukprot:13155065-Alexandrium_andersonii.AAC.1
MLTPGRGAPSRAGAGSLPRSRPARALSARRSAPLRGRLGGGRWGPTLGRCFALGLRLGPR